MKTLDEIPPYTRVVIDASKTVNIDYDVYEIIKDFENKSEWKNIDLTIEGLTGMRHKNDSVKKVQQVIEKKKNQLPALEPEQVN
jgi:MFS superfamily sulfate permease-like transporter